MITWSSTLSVKQVSQTVNPLTLSVFRSDAVQNDALCDLIRAAFRISGNALSGDAHQGWGRTSARRPERGREDAGQDR